MKIVPRSGSELVEINGETPTMRLFSLLELIASRDQLFSLQALVDDLTP